MFYIYIDEILIAGARLLGALVKHLSLEEASRPIKCALPLVIPKYNMLTVLGLVF